MYFRELKELCRTQARNEQKQNRVNKHEIQSRQIRGVVWDAYHQKYVARVFLNGREIILGRFEELADAEIEYLAIKDEYGQMGILVDTQHRTKGTARANSR